MKITKGTKSFTVAEAIRYKLQTVNVQTINTNNSAIEQKVNNVCNMLARLVEVLNYSGDIILDQKQVQDILGNDFTIKED